MKHEIKRADINVNEVLDKALELREYNLKTQNIEVQRRYQRAIETIVGDPHELLSVFLNLINNAAEAMRNGAGRGILTITTRRKKGDVEVEFEDNGPGIPPRFQDKVFDPFFTTKEVGDGVGLGLSISYGIIKEHGGELLLDKSCSGGSRFTVNLPFNADSKQEIQVADFALSERSPDSRHRILVVDDEETILDLSVDILTENGYHVETASTGEIAKEMIESEPYDLVIADIRMPGKLSGIDLFNWARQNRPGMEERIVFATGDIVAKDTQKFLSETKRPCLSKPFEMSQYLNTVRNVLLLASGNGD
jgi:CheY-like chemotaxis protein